MPTRASGFGLAWQGQFRALTVRSVGVAANIPWTAAATTTKATTHTLRMARMAGTASSSGGETGGVGAMGLVNVYIKTSTSGVVALIIWKVLACSRVYEISF